MSSPAAQPLLTIDVVGKHFGGVIALENVSFGVEEHTVLGLIGPNGSGKTTLLNIINGVSRPDNGEVRLAGIRIDGKRACDLAATGITRTFQAARVFRSLTVRQNLFIPLLHQSALDRAAASERADELLTLVGLTKHAESIASEISGGQQRLLEFARALVSRPRLVLMDEPFAGVHPQIKTVLAQCIRSILAREGTSFIIVSHEVPDLVAMSDAMLCLVEGRVAAVGLPATVIQDERVIEGYLGRG